MVSVLNSRSSSLCLSPGRGCRILFFRGTPLQCNWGLKLMVKNGDATLLNISNWQSTYLIDWVSTQCLTYTTNYFHQLSLESWYNNLEQAPPTKCHQYQNLTNDIFTWLYNTNRNLLKLTNDWWQPYQLKVWQPTLSQINWPMCFNITYNTIKTLFASFLRL